MTRPFRNSRPCPNCGHAVSLETPFSEWIRNHPDLDSSKGYVVADKDLILHQYKTEEGGELQRIMVVEVKTCNAPIEKYQADTLYLIDQFLRNRPNGDSRIVREYADPVHSIMSGRSVRVSAYGVHLLELSGLTPDDSHEIKWDRTHITKADLIGLLTFRILPELRASPS